MGRSLHPGEFFALEILPNLGSITRASRGLHMGRNALIDFCFGRVALEKDTAAHLAFVSGNSQKFWLKMYQNWRSQEGTATSDDEESDPVHQKIERIIDKLSNVKST